MAKVKLNIEIDDNVYESFKNKFNELKKVNPLISMQFNSVEQYIAFMIENYEKYEGKLNGITKNMGEKLQNILSSGSLDFNELNKLFNEKPEEEKDEDKKGEKLVD
ncbi:MAG: hypothetical protein LBS95_00795 [Mycoplasmataceae bacterium]|jgi:hypothetical protein|nr:hypothetical protein [Mycoplasmataceae bacterium]